MEQADFISSVVDFVAVACAALEAEPPEPTDDGYTLAFADGLTLTMAPYFEGRRSILLHAGLGEIAANMPGNGDFMLRILAADDGWSLTQGATIGMDRDSGELGLWQRFVLPPLSDEECAEAVRAFAETARYWRGEIAEFNAGGGEGGPPPGATPVDTGAMLSHIWP